MAEKWGVRMNKTSVNVGVPGGFSNCRVIDLV